MSGSINAALDIAAVSHTLSDVSRAARYHCADRWWSPTQYVDDVREAAEVMDQHSPVFARRIREEVLAPIEDVANDGNWSRRVGIGGVANVVAGPAQDLSKRLDAITSSLEGARSLA